MTTSGSGKSRTGYQGALIALAATLLIGLPAAADDTEIYFSAPAATTPPPLVMLTLDYRPNVANQNYCIGEAACRSQMGDEIYDQLNPAVKGGSVTLFDSFQAVFKLVFATGVFDGMKVGLMMSHKADNHCTTGSVNCSNGGYVLRGFELFEKGTDTNRAKAELTDIFAALPRDANGVSHSYQGRELFFEMYRYLAGLDVLNGHLGYTDFDSTSTTRNLDHEFTVGGSGSGTASGPAKCLFTKLGNTGDNRACTDYISAGAAYSIKDDSNYTTVTKVKGSCPTGSTDIEGTCYARISSALTWDLSIEKAPGIAATTRYKDPLQDGDWSCSGVFSINMLFQVSNQDADSDTALALSLDEQGLALDKATGTVDGFSQVIAQLKNMPPDPVTKRSGIRQGQAGTAVFPGINLTSYFLASQVDNTTNGYASAGGTYPALEAMKDPQALRKALQNIGEQINSASSSYVAVTVPVNADNRVTSLPNLFIALFQVDKDGRPYWPGNVKKLDIVTRTLADGSKQLDVKDANNELAFNTANGHLKDSALTVWTVPTAADVVAADTTKKEVSGSDGSSVMRGGAGHKIPGFITNDTEYGSLGETNATGTRRIFLEPPSLASRSATGTDSVPLDASDTSPLLTDPTKLADIQTLLGILQPGLPGGSCGSDGTYCMDFITTALDAASISYPASPSPGQKATMAKNAAQLFLRWIRGFDVFNTDLPIDKTPSSGLTTTKQRAWLMGDVLHSRPVAVNYGARPSASGNYGTANQDVRLIFGSNDGLLRMVRNTASGTAKPPPTPDQQGPEYGQEVWALMPRELLAHVPTLAIPGGKLGLNRPYGADGQPTLFTIDTKGDGIINNVAGCAVGTDTCDRAWVYFGLRRGGKSYYAVDISRPDDTIPKVMWKVSDSMTDFTELGMTFSGPRVGWVRFEDVSGLNMFGTPPANVPVPVVIFGGGYNGHAVPSGDHHSSKVAGGGPSKDTILDTPFTGNDPQGNAIYIVHAWTGRLIWKATLGSGTATATNFQAPEMKHGIAAPVSPMDSDGDGILDRLYVADTGGRVWRVDLPEFVPGATPAVTRAKNWTATLLADLRPDDLSATPNDDLRFFHGATLVRRAHDIIGNYDAIYLGSGDREHPQSEINKHNWFFLLKDRRITSGDTTSFTAYTPSQLKDVTDACFKTTTSDGICSATDLSKGWRLALEAIGEKNLSEPFIGGEGVIFTTYLPGGKVLNDAGEMVGDDIQCVPLGASRLYQVSLDTGAPLPFLRHDGEVSPTLSKDDRWINLYSGIDGGVVAVSPDFWITSTGKSGKNPPQKPVRFYWRENGVDTVK